MADTRAYFPSREEAERFARQFDAQRYAVAIETEARQGREVFQVHVARVDPGSGPAPHARELMRLLGQFGDQARHAGLDADQLGRRMGRALGEALAGRQVMPKPASLAVARRDAVHALAPLLEQCGLGGLQVVSATPFILRVQQPVGLAHPGKRCAHVAGFLEGALGEMLGQPVHAREIDCTGLGNPYCTFALDL
jgi:predicted hydrocarbon binding protein